MTILLLYIPVLHKGYLSLLQEWKNKVDILYIVGNDIIADFPLIQREIRAIDPNQMAELIGALGWFKQVRVITKPELASLTANRIIMANEVISRQLAEQYFTPQNIPVELIEVFLRWDENVVKSAKPVVSDQKISQEGFDSKIMQLAYDTAEFSADWFRRVGSVIVKDGQVIVASFNQRMPSPQAAYADGDPRNYLELGTDTHLRQTLHSEQAVIAEAAKRGVTIAGADIYVTTFPCPDCAAIIAASGIKRCFFGGGYASLDGDTIMKNAGVEIIEVVRN